MEPPTPMPVYVFLVENLGGNNFSLRFIADLNAFGSYAPTSRF